MSGLLASVTTREEALLALDGGADIIDLKNPAEGALGALPLATIREVVVAVARRRPVSATIGDLPMQPELIVDAISATAATGVDIVKLGFFGKIGHAECIAALQPLAERGIRMVAVLFADQQPDFDLVPQLAAAGLHGVMLDTALKDGRRLRHHLDEMQLRSFVHDARERGLLVGLAGALALEDVPALLPLHADYLGFRSALCVDTRRTQALDQEKLLGLSRVLHSCNTMVKDYA